MEQTHSWLTDECKRRKLPYSHKNKTELTQQLMSSDWLGGDGLFYDYPTREQLNTITKLELEVKERAPQSVLLNKKLASSWIEVTIQKKRALRASAAASSSRED